MPFCPTCQSEYRQGFTECATCKVELVDSLEKIPRLGEVEEATYFKDKPLLMVTQGGVAVCQEMQRVLEQGSVVSRITPLHGPEDAPPVAQMFKVEILEADLPKARQILGDRWRATLQAEGTGAATAEAGEAVLDPGAEATCPACAHKFIPKDPTTAECPECGLFLGVPA